MSQTAAAHPPVAPPVPVDIDRQARRSQLTLLAHDGRALAAGSILLLLGLIAVLAPILAPHDPEAIDPGASLSGPSADHWLGADQFGRDVVSRLMFGARVSLQISVESVALLT